MKKDIKLAKGLCFFTFFLPFFPLLFSICIEVTKRIISVEDFSEIWAKDFSELTSYLYLRSVS